MNSILMNLYNRSARQAKYGWNGEDVTLYLAPSCVTSIGEAFYKSNADCFDWELVILDWYSTDCDPVLWADEYMQGKLPIRIIKQEGQFDRGRGRNILAHNSQGSNILFFIDADMMIQPELINRALDVMKDKDIYYPVCRYYLNPYRTLMTGYIHTARGNFFITRNAWNRTLGFKEGEGWGKEDTRFYEQVKVKGRFNIVSEESPYIFHQWHPQEFRD